MTVLLVLALLGCGGGKTEDADGDGALVDIDCNDADPAVHPGSAEACNGVDDNCDGATDEGLVVSDWLPDADGDGFGAGEPVSACAPPPGTSAAGDDCDDADATTFPGAPERCDDVDHDCDGLVNEPSSTDAAALFRDADGDGFGGDAQTACPGAPSTAATAGDCDDTDPEVSPVGIEACTPAGRDEDCDGLVDDADDSLADGTSWWRDADGDGYGSGDPILACGARLGLVALPGDCDDDDADTHPGAAEPDCAGGVDQNCDGVLNAVDRDGDGEDACSDCDDADEHVHAGAPEACNDLDDDCDGAVDEGLPTSPYFADHDGDGHGDPAVTSDRCGPNADWVATADDCDDAVSTTYPGADERCSVMGDEDCDGRVNEEGAADCHEYARDADGDGYGDADDIRCLCSADGEYTDTVSGYTWSPDCDDADATRAPYAAETCGDNFDADCDGLDGCDIDELPLVGEGTASRDFWGIAAAAGDLTGDGVTDLAVGVPGQYAAPGRVEVYEGPLTFPLPTPTWRFTHDGDDALGTALAVTDLDGDGQDDLVATAPYHSGRSGVDGALYGLRGPLTADGTLDSLADLTLDGGDRSTVLGTAVAAGSDLDGDGGLDLVVTSGDAGTSSQGYTWIFPADWGGAYVAADAPTVITGVEPYEGAGREVDAGADVDGDGAADLLIGSLYAGYVFYGPVSGSFTVRDADVILHEGEQSWGRPHHFVPDIDGDGRDDALAEGPEGVYLQTDLTAGRRSSGAAWAAVITTDDYVDTPTDVVARDVDGDGALDVLVGTGNSSVGRGSYGAVYLLRGPIAPGAHAIEAEVGEGWVGDSSSSKLGDRLLPLGDIDGSAGDEVLLWGWGSSTSAGYGGAAWYLSAASLP